MRDLASRRDLDRKMLTIFVLLCAIAVTALRVVMSLDLPLWLDETWTAMIATQPDWASFWHEAWLDCNAPLYYVFERLWVWLAGDSNIAMRLPSAILLYAAAAMPLVWTGHGLNRLAAVIWSGLIVLWWPGSMIALDARAYGLLLFLSAFALLGFMRAYRVGDTRSFALWAVLCALQLLTHYFACFLIAAQGVLLLWKWRWALLKRCYAFAPLAVPVIWGAYHLPRLRDYARPDVVWYTPTDLQSAIGYASYTFGPPAPIFAPLIVLALGAALWKSGWKLNKASSALDDETKAPAIHAACLAGAMALASVLLATAFMASLTERYMVPLAPTVLLTIVVLASRIPQTNMAYVLLITLYMVYAIAQAPLKSELKSRAFYGYEVPSSFVQQVHPTDLVFVWDHPAAKILSPRSLEQIGSFFLRRAGNPVRTKALILSENDDPNVAIRQAVSNKRTGILWLYDAHRRSAAKNFPPVLANDPAWKCLDRRSYGRDGRGRKFLKVGTIACVPRDGALP